MYAERGRPSIPPEHLLKASLLIALYSIRSERQFCERLRYDLLFKWFLDLNIADPGFDASTFSKNRERLLDHDVARAFFSEVVAEAKRRRLLSAEHFTVDGTLLEAWASLKSYRPRDEQDRPGAGGGRNPEVDFRGERRSRETHASSTDPEALLFKKGASQAAKLSYMGHLLTENRHGLVVDVELTQATGTAERAAALLMLERRGGRHATLGADKAYDTRDFVAALRERGVTPHVAQHTSGRRSAVDRRTTRHAGYARSQRRRKLVEEVFGWIKTVAGGRKLRYRGVARNRLWAELTAAAYNLVRMAKLEAAAA
jgi:transposase